MLQQVFHHTDNRSNTCLIVRAQQGRPIGRDQVLSLIHKHLGEVFGAEHDPQLFVEYNIAAVIIFNHLRLDIVAGHIGRSIHMRNKAEYRNVKIHIGWQRTSHIAKFIHLRVSNADAFELFYQVLRKHFLFRRTGETVCAGCGLGIKADIL